MFQPVLVIIRLSKEQIQIVIFILLSVSVLFHSILSDSCFDSVCQAMRM